MITPISNLVIKTARIRKILKFFGSTLDYGQNSRGDWTIITVTKWPLIPIGLAVILWMTWHVYIYVIPFQQGIAFIDQYIQFLYLCSLIKLHFTGISFSKLMYAHLSNELSTTDMFSFHSLQLTNLIILIISPMITAKFAKVFTHFFEETARIGRKINTNGLITNDCAEG